MAFDESLLTGSTTMMVLKMLEDKDMYGYQMIEELTKKSDDTFTLKAGALYPLLYELERQGLVSSYDGSAGGAELRKYYSITKKGKGLLANKKAKWEAYTSAVNQVLQGVLLMEQRIKRIKIKQYLETICSQIKYKKIHGEISEEIENHINDQKEVFKAQGIEDETALSKAIGQMGEPVIIGAELNRTHRAKPEWSIMALTFLLLLTGVLIRLFSPAQDAAGWEPFYLQLIFIAAGTGLMALCYNTDFTLVGRYPKPIFLSLAVLTIAAIFIAGPPHDRYVYAAHLLLLFPAAFAGVVYSIRDKGYLGMIMCGLFFVIPFAISIMAASAATSILLALTSLLTLTIAVFKNWFGVKKLQAMLFVYLPALIVIPFIASATGFLRERIELAFPSSINPVSAGYVGDGAGQLLSKARFIGQGALPETPGGVSASAVLADMNGDYLLTCIIHCFGWFAFIIAAALLTAFIARAFILCTKQKSVLAFLLSLAVTTTITLQALFHAAANLGLQLFPPLSLPLISSGGPSLLINMCLVGILLSVFRTGYFVKDKSNSKKVPAKSFLKFEDGKLTFDFSLDPPDKR